MKSDTTGLELAVVICLCIVLIPVFSAIAAAIIFLAWNYAIAAAFHFATLTFLQCALIAIGISFVGGCFKATINKVSKD